MSEKVIERREVFQYHRETAGAAGLHPQAIRVGVPRAAGEAFDDILLVLRPQDHDVGLAGLPVTVISVRVESFIGSADALGAGRLDERKGERQQFDEGGYFLYMVHG